MRILFISAFYPPHVVGGWEQLVRDINERLRSRGHTTHVLTSTFGVDSATCEAGIDRLLTLESDIYHYQPGRFITHKQRLKRNLHMAEQTIAAFKPDVVFIHVMWNLSRGIAWVAEQSCPGRVVYYVANDWPHAPDPNTAYWQEPANHPIARLCKGLIAPIPLKLIEAENKRFSLQFERVLCVSQAIKKNLAEYASIPQQNLSVVYNGVETDLFVPPSSNGAGPHQTGLRLLYAGSLNPHKGVHTAIEAMGLLHKDPNYRDISLDIAGAGHVDYEARLRKLVSTANLEAQVQFLGRVPREQMPALLQRYDILVFPSIWEEPLARMTQEAMAVGLVVVGTLTGGSGELLIDGETGLAFEPDNAADLARRISELHENDDIMAKLSHQGRGKVLREFDFRHTIDEIEAQLARVVGLRLSVEVEKKPGFF